MCIRVCGLWAHIVYLYSILTYTAHSASYIKALMYILLLEKYNKNIHPPIKYPSPDPLCTLCMCLPQFKYPSPKDHYLPLPSWILLRLHFCKYHCDRLAPIHSSVELSQPSEIARASQSFSQILPRSSRATNVVLILSPPLPLESSISDLHHRTRISLI